MKFKKLISLVLSLSVVSSYAVQASAASWTDPSGSQVDAGQWAGYAVSSAELRYRYYGEDSRFPNFGNYNGNDYYLFKTNGNQHFSDFLRNQLEYVSASRDYVLPRATIGISGVTDFTDAFNRMTPYLPTLIGKSDMQQIAYRLKAPSLSFPIDDPVVGLSYTASLTSAGAQDLAASLASYGDVNLALSFSANATNRVLRISLVGVPQGLKGSIEYKMGYSAFDTLLSRAGLSGKTLTMYSSKDNSVLKPIVSTMNDAAFTLSSSNGWSIYYTIWDETEYISKSEAQKMIEDAIGNLKKTDIADLEQQIADLKNQVKKLDDKYVTESEVNKLINSYFEKETNLKALVEAIFKHEKFEDLIEKKLLEFFGAGDSNLGSFKNILISYIIGQVTTDLKNLDARLEKLEDLIIKAIDKQLGNIFNQNTTLESLKDFILGLQLLGSLKGEDGKDGKDGVNGKDGIDGEDFAEWANRNYGGISNFINQISFEGWARSNYGSVDNFIRSISGTNGFSAYELAVQNGYYGSLGQWLESLRGKDGKSAYELAVENGYNGTERQWLDSLHGEDGADGEDGEDGRDGRDGRDGNVVYVNGTYGELPGNNAAGTTQSPSSSGNSANGDVTLTIDPPASSGKKGGAANPATGAAFGIVLPAAAALSVFLVKKGGRRRGRK